MKTETLELAVDAVADAVRALLPELVARAIAAQVAPLIAEAIRVEGQAWHAELALRIAASDERLKAASAASDERLNAATSANASAYTDLLGELDTRIDSAEERVAEKIGAAITIWRTASAEQLTARDAALDVRLNAITSANTNAYNELAEDMGEQIKSHVAAAVAALPSAAPGPRGEPGRDGRDGTYNAPVHWHEGRVFARGAVVIHAGGVWVASVDTDAAPDAACSGYALLLDGVLPHEVEHDERGYISLAYKYASGRRLSVPLHFRPPLYCGVYEAERAYEPNDLVTCAGSLWWARAASRGAKPGTDQAARLWVLSVKCGRDGERGERGPPGERGLAGEQGPIGPAGRDGKPPGKRATPSNGAAA